MAANTNAGIVLKSTKGGYIVAKFLNDGFIKMNHVTTNIGANSAGETVTSMNIISMQVNIGGANSCYFTIKRGSNTICTLTGQDFFDLSDCRLLDSEGGNPQANVVVTKTGDGPSTLVLKIHKQCAISGRSIY